MFPCTITVHNAAQMHAVLLALQPDLAASDFKSPAVGVAYEEVSGRIKAREAEAKAPAPQEVKPDPKPQAQATAAPAPAKPAPTPPTAAAPAAAAPAVRYDQVKKIVNEMYAIDPQHAIDALAKFGVKNGKELPEAKWGEFVAHGQAQLEALKTPA